MNHQNPLEEILYGQTNGKKTFSQFRKGRTTEEENSSLEEDKRDGSSKRKDTLRRMGNSYQRTKREKKIQKLSDNSDHWKGLS